MAHDGIAQERRRLSAVWLNIVAAGIVSAGAINALTALVSGGLGERTGSALALGGAALLVGYVIHLLARAVIREG